jgi:hypothetical protein
MNKINKDERGDTDICTRKGNSKQASEQNKKYGLRETGEN